MKKKIIVEGHETNYSVTSDGKVFNDKTGRELRGTYARNEYHSVQLIINQKPRTFMVHRLVAEAFCENPNGYTIVDHIDRNKLNNKASNLEWKTSSENAKNKENKIKSSHEYLDLSQLNFNDWEYVDRDKDYMINRNGQLLSLRTRILIKGNIRNGYVRYSIKGKKYSAHILVWKTFRGEIPENMVIDHINGVRNDNRLENLRLISQSENMLNSQKLGHKGQIKISQFDKEGDFIKKYNSMQDAANEVGVTHAAVRSAANRKGTCKGYYWIRDDQNFTIEDLIPTLKMKNIP